MTRKDFIEEWNNAEEHVMVHTSGSTGKPKALLVEKKRMLASARITCDFLGLKAGDTALLCMPLDFIAGKMMVVRSIERQLKLIVVKPSNHPLASSLDDSNEEIAVDFDKTTIDFAAMVPSQVYGSLQVPEERKRLENIGHLIIGGGAISKETENELRHFPNAVWSTYGMTETLSHIALRRISGETASLWYTPFDGVEIGLVNNDSNIGQLVIDAPLVCKEQLVTNDIVEIVENEGRKQFRIIGRTDNVICSGGIKLHIEEIEETLHRYLKSPFCISKREDAKFGEVAVLIVELNASDNSIEKTAKERILEICRKVLPQYSVPKDVLLVDKVPLTQTGKIDRASALKIASTNSR